ncbi:hypothetical protein THAOC_22995, partial [Thalassiosira oceanica]
RRVDFVGDWLGWLGMIVASSDSDPASSPTSAVAVFRRLLVAAMPSGHVKRRRDAGPNCAVPGPIRTGPGAV